MTEVTTASTTVPLFSEAFISSLVMAAYQDPAIEPALLADFDGTIKKLGLVSPVSGKLAKDGSEYIFSYEGGSIRFATPEIVIGQGGELADRDLDAVAGGKIDVKGMILSEIDKYRVVAYKVAGGIEIAYGKLLLAINK